MSGILFGHGHANSRYHSRHADGGTQLFQM